MEWLFSNPVADLSGPAFLVVYALVAVAVIVACRAQLAAADPSGFGTPPAVAVDRDPYEVAYLRGGGNELLRFSIFDLTRQGFLRIGDPPKPGKKPTKIVATGRPGDESLTAFARRVVEFYAVPRTTLDVFSSELPAAAAEFGAATYAPRLQADGFFAGDDVRRAARRVRAFGALGLIVLAGYRFLNAFVKHHNNVIFLAIETLVALALLFALTRTPRVSRRGRSYLERLTTALRPVPLAPVAAGLGVLPILVAATGFDALAGTEFAPVNALFPKRASASASGTCSGGCGGGSSGGGDGSSSCGGGCGGGCGG